MDDRLEKIKEELKEYIKDNKPKYLYNKNFIPGESQVLYSGPYWDEEEIMAAIETLIIGKWVVAGENVRKFERRFAKKFGAKYGQMVNSGSSANLVLLAGLKKYFGWNDNDEIIVSPVGFPTTISTIVQNGLKPIFVDIEFDTLNFDVTKIEEKITPRTKAIFVSPVLANPPDMDYLTRLCNKHGLQLIGDSCDSIGSKWDGNDLSDYYVAWTSSFYPAHHISSLPYEEIVLVKSPKGKIKTIEIGKFVEDIDYHGWQCVSFDGESNIKWRDITDVVKHKTNKEVELLKITTQGGRNCVITANHSVFKYGDKNGTILNINAEDLNVNDFILVPNNLPNIEEKIELEFTGYIKGSWKEFKYNMPLDEDLAYILGWFVAEGSFNKTKSGNYMLNYSLHENEYDVAEKICEILKKKFKVSPKIYKVKNSKAIAINLSSKTLYNFLLEFCGKGSSNKMVPEFIFRAKNNIKWKFINSYFSGDGHHHIIESSKSNSFDARTVSKDLADGLYHLLLMLGVSPRYSKIKLQEPKIIHNNKKKSIFKQVYEVCYNESLNSIVSSKEFRNSTKNDFIRSKNDLTMIKVTKIEKVKYNKPYVYDLSVKGYENFVSGIGFTVHNTGEGGMVCTNIHQLSKLFTSFTWWGRDCYCVGSANLLPCGTCGNRFDKWLDSYDGIIDHKYVFANMGYNLKPMDLQGAIGLKQLERFDEIDERRKRSKITIEKLLLKHVIGVKDVKMLPKADTCWFGTPFICKSKELKDKLVSFLEENKIQTRNYFAGNILMHEGYKHLDRMEKYPNANEVLDKVFFLGAAPHYDENVFDYIHKIFKEKWRN